MNSAEAEATREQAQEQELRQLLEYGIPELAAPRDRMRQIHRRVARGRRRRRLALLTAVASVVAAAGLQGILRAQSPVGERPVQVSAPKPATTTAVTNDLGLILKTHNTWHTVTLPDARSLVTVFVSNGALGEQVPCTEPTSGGFTCAPVSALAEGEVLVAFRQEDEPHDTHWKKAFTVRALDGPEKSCLVIGGDQELVGWGSAPRPLGDRPAINAYVCLRGASEATTATVEELLDTAHVRVITPSPAKEPTVAATTDAGILPSD